MPWKPFEMTRVMTWPGAMTWSTELSQSSMLLPHWLMMFTGVASATLALSAETIARATAMLRWWICMLLLFELFQGLRVQMESE